METPEQKTLRVLNEYKKKHYSDTSVKMVFKFEIEMLKGFRKYIKELGINFYDDDIEDVFNTYRRGYLIKHLLKNK